MTWKQAFTSSVVKKLLMGLTGIFLILFLIVHAGLNACIWANDGGVMFKRAAHYMGSNVILRILDIGLFLYICIHIIQGYVLEASNRSKRKISYAVSYGNRGSKWYSRSMAILGTILLLFFIVHWKQFWIPSRFTGIEETTLPKGIQVYNLYALMQSTFSELWVVIFCIMCCIVMEKDIKPSDSMSHVAFENPVTIVMALGGSTNAVLHLIAMAKTIGVPFTINDFQKICDKVPLLADF
jgi:succinate dehydrogenase / fumarate reductase cytochrome b subunit